MVRCGAVLCGNKPTSGAAVIDNTLRYFCDRGLTNFEMNNHSRSSDVSSVSLSAFAYVYSELVQYHQGRAASISELERRLESAGYGVGLKVLECVAYRGKEVSSSWILYGSFMEFSLDAL